jgi:alkanesulfonate monooxygenase SsuD/methylene tetrahydromethanopterin reductase-like flavin-dependent oxidoreductase (luciferase family)
LGYDYLTLTDQIVLPNLRVPGYPYSESGEFFGEGPERRHEQLTAAAFIAAKTSRIRLVLAVMVVPHRPAVLAAKMLSTIGALSGGRLVVGIGAGWLEAEFGAVVTTSFAERGRVTDEYLRAFRSLWTEGTPRFEGSWVKVICSISLRRFARDPVAICPRTSLRSLPRSAPVNSWNRRDRQSGTPLPAMERPKIATMIYNVGHAHPRYPLLPDCSRAVHHRPAEE